MPAGWLQQLSIFLTFKKTSISKTFFQKLTKKSVFLPPITGNNESATKMSDLLTARQQLDKYLSLKCKPEPLIGLA